jgi:CRP/FNR family transcriptional regulator, anaerobic regulatory protein
MKTVKKADFLKVFPAFKDAPDSMLFEILAYGRPTVFEKDHYIFHENDACAAVGFFFSGGARIFKSGPAAREVTLYTIGRGDVCILNAACILSSTGYPATAVVTEKSEALAVPSAHFRGLVNRYPEMRSFVFSLLGSRLFEVIEMLEDVLFRRMNERLEEYLRKRAGKGSLRATHQNIANDLGTSREVVSRLLKDLERSGTVVLERNRIRFIG